METVLSGGVRPWEGLGEPNHWDGHHELGRGCSSQAKSSIPLRKPRDAQLEPAHPELQLCQEPSHLTLFLHYPRTELVFQSKSLANVAGI